MTTKNKPEMTTSTAYDELITMVKDAHLLGGTLSHMHWDQEVMMPAGGLPFRSKQIAQLARMHHELITDARIGDLLSQCEQDSNLTSDQTSPSAVNIRALRRDYDRKTKLPAKLVEEEAELASIGQHIWSEARKEKDFSKFQPTLEKIIDLLRRKADCYGWAAAGEPWDALAEDYEPGCTAAEVERVFTPLRKRLQTLLDDLMGKGTPPSNAFNEAKLDIDAQEKFVRFVSEQLGFDYKRGRLDRSTHPFCTGEYRGDIRLTTRFHEDNVNDALGSTMHEAGHGMYEQGVLEEHTGTPMGQAVSLGIHESQSRMWENQVGRSRTFWQWCQPKLKDFFGNALDHLSVDDLYGAANIVRPDFIRVEADEATYNMHIMIRFEIERTIMRGDLKAADIPDVWNTRYKEYLGLDVPDDAKGCLQDVHWSMAAMGYFPTYTLGNLYCAQFFEKAREDISGLDDMFARGEFAPLRKWLNTNIHEQGRRYRPGRLCEVVTGKPLTADPLMRHLENKLRPLYQL